MFQADELLLALRRADVTFVTIGGIAVGVHGYVRATKDLDIVPDPERANLARLASLLRDIGAEQVGAGEFSAEEFPYDYAALAREAITVRFRNGDLLVCGLVMGLARSVTRRAKPARRPFSSGTF